VEGTSPLITVYDKFRYMRFTRSPIPEDNEDPEKSL